MLEQESKNETIATFYVSHRDEVLRFVERWVHDVDDAQDIVQNVFFRILRSNKMITKVTLPSLVFTTARHLVYDYWRHHRAMDEYEHYLRYRGSGSEEAGVLYNAQEIEEILERGIARLSDRQQTVYRMHVYGGMKVSEISTTLRLGYKNVEKQLWIARKDIRYYMTRMLA